MRVRFHASDPLGRAAPLLVVGLTLEPDASSGFLARLDERLGGALRRVVASGDVTGRSGEEALLYVPEGGADGPARVLLVGLGDPARVGAEGVRRMLGRAVRYAERIGVDAVAARIEAPGVRAADAVRAAAEGAALAAWSFRELRGPAESDPRARVVAADLHADGEEVELAEAARVGAVVAEAENLARTLQARPGNVATPAHLAEEAARVAAEVGLEVTVLDEAALGEAGMHAILAVSRGSREEARLIVLEHRGGRAGEAPLVLVGKGLTFDAGGISLKPAKDMDRMKFDMSGGAAVIGAMRAVAELGVRANVVGIVPASENLPSSTALKPGDVIRTLAGKTVEVLNTDAEGRLILADALAYGARLAPAAMVDCATLTGAVVIALGHHAAAVLGNDEGLVEELRAAGERSGERCWPLPLWDEYRRQLDGDAGDLLNVGGRPAGTITAAAFLREFVGDVPWAHLDIAGTAYGDFPQPYQRKGGYGFPTRLLVEWVRSRTV